MERITVILPLTEPIEYIKRLVREATNHVRHPDSPEAHADADAWEYQPFFNGLLTYIFSYDKKKNPHYIDPNEENKNPLWYCEAELLNAGCDIDDATMIAQAVYELTVDTLGAYMGELTFDETQTHEWKLIDPLDLMVSTIHWTAGERKNDLGWRIDEAFRRENSWD